MQISERLKAVFHCAGYSQNSMIALTFRADSHQHQHQIETFFVLCRMFKDNPFPLPKHIDSFFFPGEQTNVLCLCKTHINLSLLCVSTNKSINTSLRYIHVYCLQYVCMWMSVPVCVMFALLRFPVTKRRCLTLWGTTELSNSWVVPLLSVVHTVVVPWARGGRGSLVGRGTSQLALLIHPNTPLPSPERWSGEGSSQALCDKGT